MSVPEIVRRIEERRPEWRRHHQVLSAFIEARGMGEEESGRHTIRVLSVQDLVLFGLNPGEVEQDMQQAVQAGLLEERPAGWVMSQQFIRFAESAGAVDLPNWTKSCRFAGEDVPRRRVTGEQPAYPGLALPTSAWANIADRALAVT